MTAHMDDPSMGGGGDVDREMENSRPTYQESEAILSHLVRFCLKINRK